MCDVLYFSLTLFGFRAEGKLEKCLVFDVQCFSSVSSHF